MSLGCHMKLMNHRRVTHQQPYTNSTETRTHNSLHVLRISAVAQSSVVYLLPGRLSLLIVTEAINTQHSPSDGGIVKADKHKTL